MLWLNESLNLLFFDCRYPRSFAIAVVASLLGFNVPYMLAADVLCMAEASVATLVKRHTILAQSYPERAEQLATAIRSQCKTDRSSLSTFTAGTSQLQSRCGMKSCSYCSPAVAVCDGSHVLHFAWKEGLHRSLFENYGNGRLTRKITRHSAERSLQE